MILNAQFALCAEGTLPVPLLWHSWVRDAWNKCQADGICCVHAGASWGKGERSFYLSLLHPSLLIPLNSPILFPKTM